MKTKYLLSVLCLGALASCSNEDLVEQTISDANLPKVNLTIGAEFGDMAQTRQAYGDNLTDWSYYWTNADIIGACKASGTDGTLDAGDKISSNHPFTNDLEEGKLERATTFSTVTAVTTGKYILYAPYKKSMLDNEEIKPKLPEIQLQEGTSRKHLMDSNFFVTPMLDIQNGNGLAFEYGANIDLPLTFKSIYHTLDMQIGITSATPQAITVDKVVVTPTSDNTGTVIATKNGEALDFDVISKAGGSANANVVKVNATTVADQNALSKDIQTKLDELMKLTNDIQTGTTADNSYTLKIKNGYKYTKADDKCRVFMLIPAGSYNFLKCEVYTSEGIYTEYVKLDAAGTAVAMNRNAVTHINNSLNIHYNVGDNNVKPQTNFAISSVDDWNYACKFVEDHFNMFGDPTKWGTPTFTLKNDIEVESYPADFGLKLDASAAKTLTVKAKNFNLDKTELNGTNVTIKVATGSTLTLNKEVANAETNLKLINLGTIVNNIKPTISASNLKLTFASLTNGENTWTGQVGVVTNNGVIEVPATNGLTNNLKGIINSTAGTKIKAAATKAITNRGKIKLEGKDSELEVKGAGGVENEGTITVAPEAKITDGGSGTIKEETSKGTIVLEDINKYTLDPTTSNQIVSVEVANLDDFKTARAATKVNDITVTAALTTDANVNAAGKSITLQKNLTLKGDFTADQVIVDGNAVIASDGTTARKVSAGLTVVAGAELTVNKEITFNAMTGLTTGTNALILGTLNVNGKMYFDVATVGKEITTGPQVRNGTLNIADVEGAEFAASAQIENWGDVNQNAGKGKVGPSVHNNGPANFSGNADNTLTTTTA